ncbi:DUF2785 domain-containing protein [Haloplasma contractile]|uniref:DUF2785 domain-containing protein n=1 Tax=Haloplasma contractile SSD-17B TaxID=1033810 RepID=U2E9K9_9MOLU|nr:DUF2785 domain-containing protein [Haloplasma contractile]ERJ11828.1 hypothetical protein HLPCO_002067 [Haloplasma contractile SSD-17B]
MKIDRIQLKQLLFRIKEDKFMIPNGYKAASLGHAMITHIGDTDPILRDELIYEVLENWTLNDVFTIEEVKDFLEIAFDDQHLFFRIGDKHDNSVFTRTFSLLFIAAALYKHNINPYLSKDDIISYLDKIISYLEREVDVRGFVKEKGWAHSVAHCSDVLGQFAKCDELETSDHKKILNAIANKIAHRKYTYIDEEDERAVTAVMNVIRKEHVSQDEFCTWINDLVQIGTLKIFPDDSVIHVNVKHFLRSLYFRLINEEQFNQVLNVLKDALCRMNRFN